MNAKPIEPFPTKQISDLADRVKGILSVEMSSGQMIEDVRLAVNGKVPAELRNKPPTVVGKGIPPFMS